MNRFLKKIKGATILEVLSALVIISIVVVSFFGVYVYVSRIQSSTVLPGQLESYNYYRVDTVLKGESQINDSTTYRIMSVEYMKSDGNNFNIQQYLINHE